MEKSIISSRHSHVTGTDWGSNSSMYGGDVIGLRNPLASCALSEAREVVMPCDQDATNRDVIDCPMSPGSAWKLQGRFSMVKNSSGATTVACCSTASGPWSDRTDCSSGACDAAEWIPIADNWGAPPNANDGGALMSGRATSHAGVSSKSGTPTSSPLSRATLVQANCHPACPKQASIFESRESDDGSVDRDVIPSLTCSEDSSPQELRALRQQASELGRRLQERERQCLALKHALQGCGLSVASLDKVVVPVVSGTACVGGPPMSDTGKRRPLAARENTLSGSGA